MLKDVLYNWEIRIWLKKIRGKHQQNTFFHPSQWLKNQIKEIESVTSFIQTMLRAAHEYYEIIDKSLKL